MTTREERNLRARAIRLQNDSPNKTTLQDAIRILTTIVTKD